MAFAAYDNSSFCYDDPSRLFDGYENGIPFSYKVILQNPSGSNIAWLNDSIVAGSLNFNFSRLGGCAEGSVKLLTTALPVTASATAIAIIKNITDVQESYFDSCFCTSVCHGLTIGSYIPSEISWDSEYVSGLYILHIMDADTFYLFEHDGVTITQFISTATATFYPVVDFDSDLADYRILIYINSIESNIFTLVYSGYITDDSPSFGSPDSITLSFKGFSDMLTRLVSGRTDANTVKYGAPDSCQWPSGTAIVDIVKQLAADLPNFLPIVYDADLIDDSGMLLQNVLSMRKTANECFNDISKLAGNYEWGIDEQRRFYFKAPSTTVKTFWYGAGVTTSGISRSYSSIKNRCLVQDGSYTDTYEADSDMVAWKQQTLASGNLACGTAANQAIRQTFRTTKRSISRVRIGVKMVGSESANMITDGDMEASGVTNWPKIFQIGVDHVEKDTTYRAFGTQGLKCTVVVPLGGVVLTKTTVVGTTYALRWWHWVTKGTYQVEVDNGVDGTGRVVLAQSDVFRNGGASQSTFINGNLSFTATTTTTRIYFKSPYGNAIFGLDNVSLLKNSAILQISLVDPATESVLARDTKPVNVTDYTDFDFDLHYYGAHVDSITTYALDIRPVALTAGDVIYWLLQYDAAASIVNGALAKFNGSTWDAVTGALTVKIYYNSSQEIYGLREELTSPVVQGADNKEYINSYLAGISTVVRRLTITLEKQRSVLHSVVPASGLGLVSFRIPKQTTVTKDQIEQLNYSVGDNGLSISISAGKRLPYIAYQLEYIKQKLLTHIGLTS